MKKVIIILAVLTSFNCYAQLEFGCTQKDFEETLAAFQLNKEILNDSSVAITLDNEEVLWYIYFDKNTSRSYAMDVLARTQSFYNYFIRKTKKYKRIDENKWEYKLTDGETVMMTLEEKNDQKWFRWNIHN